MLARTAFRAAQPLRMHARRYASDAGPKPSGPNNTTLLGGAALAAITGLGYYLVTRPLPTPPASSSSSSSPPKPTFTGGEQGWVPLTVAAVEDVNHNTKRLRFHLPSPDAVSGLSVASAVLTKFKPAGAEKATIRPYTPVSDEADAGFLDLLVKKYPGGPMSSHIHALAPGQTLDFKGPLPKYPWARNKHAHVALVAGGTGITPMWQLVRAILADPDDTTRVTLVFGNVAEEDILLRPQLDELENTHPRRFRAFYTLDKPGKAWAGEKGVVTRELLKQVLPEPKEDNIKVFVCGPPGLMKAVSGAKKSPKDQGELSGALKELGYSAEQVYKF